MIFRLLLILNHTNANKSEIKLILVKTEEHINDKIIASKTKATR
jgi:hypothetical protein